MFGSKYFVMAINFNGWILKCSSFSNCNFLNPVLRAPWYYPQKPQETKETDFRISLSCCRVVKNVMSRNMQKIVLETTQKNSLAISIPKKRNSTRWTTKNNCPKTHWMQKRRLWMSFFAGVFWISSPHWLEIPWSSAWTYLASHH